MRMSEWILFSTRCPRVGLVQPLLRMRNNPVRFLSRTWMQERAVSRHVFLHYPVSEEGFEVPYDIFETRRETKPIKC